MEIVKTTLRSFPQESLTDLGQVLASRFAEEIRAHWDDVEDIVDFGGHETVFPYQRVLDKGKEHFAEIMHKIWTAKHRRSDPQRYIDELWAEMEKVSEEESSLFA